MATQLALRYKIHAGFIFQSIVRQVMVLLFSVRFENALKQREKQLLAFSLFLFTQVYWFAISRFKYVSNICESFQHDNMLRSDSDKRPLL